MKRTKISLHLLEDIADGALTQEELQGFVGGGDGTYTNPCSIDEYYSMLDDGTWSGGYIIDDEGSISYVPVGYGRCYGTTYHAAYSGYGEVMGFTEFTLGQLIGTITNTSELGELRDMAISSVLPITSGIYEVISIGIRVAYNKLAAAVADADYAGDKKFDVVITHLENVTYRLSAITPSGKILYQTDFSQPI